MLLPRRKFIFAGAVLLLICTLALALLPNWNISPFATGVTLSGPSYAAWGPDGSRYVVDSALRRIICTDSTGAATSVLTGGRSDNTFFNVGSVASDETGTIYISDTRFAENGNDVLSERILSLSPSGKAKVLSVRTYSDWSQPPRYQGTIRALTVADGILRFAQLDENSISICHMEESGAVADFQLPLERAWILAQDVAFGPDGGTVVCTLKDGRILRFDLESGTQTVLYDGNTAQGWSVPWCVGVDAAGTVYFTDLGTRQIRALKGTQVSTVVDSRYSAGKTDSFGSSPIFYQLTVSPDGSLASTDTFHALFVDHTGQGLDTNTLPLAGRMRLILVVRLCLLIAGGILLVCALGLGLRWLWQHQSESSGKNSLIIAVVALSTALLVTSLLVRDNRKRSNAELLHGIESMATAATGFVDGDALTAIDSLSDFDSPSYQKLKKTMDAVMEASGAYYLFYRTDGETVYRVMDYVNMVGPMTPMDTAFPGSDYEAVMHTGIPRSYSSVQDSTGIWTLTLAPIYGKDGDVTAVIEVGRNSAVLESQEQDTLLRVLLSVLGLTVVMVLTLTELSYFPFLLAERRRLAALPAGQRRLSVAVVRPLTFGLLIADFMQNSFEPVYVSQLYQPFWGLPKGIATSIALSAEVFAVSVSAALGGRLRRALGLKRMLYGGALLGGLGFLLRGLAPSIPWFILGKLVTGAGMGTVFVALNTFIAEQERTEDSDRGFTAYYASYLAAINVGVVFGSALAEQLGYRAAYCISSGIMVVCVLGVSLLLRGDLEPPRQAEPEQVCASPRLTLRRFLVDRRIFGFLAFLFIPYLLTSYFLYYFYPIFANALGVSDSLVGQTFLINGLCVIYLGPTLTPLLLRRLGSRLTGAAAGALCVLGLTLFTLRPTLPGALLCILIMGVADSFAFTAMSSYWSEQNSFRLYGAAPAAGVKSMAENLGYAAAPFAYSSALLLGNAAGIQTIAAVFTGCILVFLTLTRKGKET